LKWVLSRRTQPGVLALKAVALLYTATALKPVDAVLLELAGTFKLADVTYIICFVVFTS